MLNRPLVLVAIDHATDVKRTIEVARRVATARGADVDVIQVVPHRTWHVDEAVSMWRGGSADDGGVRMEPRLASTLRHRGDDAVPVRSITLRGAPEHVIPAYSQLHRATLLVVQRDYGSPTFWRNGRVVDELARQSPMPVLVLPEREPPTQDEPGLRRILTPVDFSVASAVALRTTAELSRHHGARVTLVHALADVPRHMVFSGSEAWNVVQRLPAQLDVAASRLRRKAAMWGVTDVDTEVATGDVQRAILEVAARSDADLIVMGIAHRSWLDRMVFGSTLRRVVRRAMVPVLAIPVVAGAHTWPNEHSVDRIPTVWPEPAVDRLAA